MEHYTRFYITRGINGLCACVCVSKWVVRSGTKLTHNSPTYRLISPKRARVINVIQLLRIKRDAVK